MTPSHVIPQILSALDSAVKKGLSIPIVYNSGGYDDVGALKLLDGVVDIYMPDFKFWEPRIADLTCNAPIIRKSPGQQFVKCTARWEI